MGGNSVKNASDVQSDPTMCPPSPTLYKLHQSPTASPTKDTFHTASPDGRPTPMDTSPSPEVLSALQAEHRSVDGLGAPFGWAMKRIQRATCALDEMHSQLKGLLTPGSSTEGHQIPDSALGWEARLTDVRKDLKGGLRELGDLRRQYEALSAGSGTENIKPTDIQEHMRVLESEEERIERERLQDCIYQLEREKVTLTERIIELQGEVKDLNLLQSDLRTAVSVAERFREEAQQKLEICEKENQRLRSKGSENVDWAETNGSLQGYHSLPRGVILSSKREPIIKSSSLMNVPPSSSLAHNSVSEAASSRKERRGSLETLLNQSKATENLTEDSGSFFRRYGGSKRGVFLRWAQDRTCGYKHVVITNFSTSWVDGMALCALLHSYLPQSIPYSQLRPLEKRKNLQLAFQVAESVGIPLLLATDHMLQPQGPDWQKVLLYVESIYQKFEA